MCASHCQNINIMASISTRLLKQYQDYLDTTAGLCVSNSQPYSLPSVFHVGVVGGGMAGLYSALLLQKHLPGVKVKIFEASNRVGGYLHTHKFSEEPHQYFECGAMRFPNTEIYKPIFDMIERLNKEFPTDSIKLYQYKNQSMGNRVFINNTKQKDGCIMSTGYAAEHFDELGFPAVIACKQASTLMAEGMKTIADALEEDFERACKKYGQMSAYECFSNEFGWSFEKISYVELMCLHSNIFHYGVLDLFWHFLAFEPQAIWHGIEGGMAKFPKMCAEFIRNQGGVIKLSAKVESINQLDKGVKIGYIEPESIDLLYEQFDCVILAIQCPHIRQIPDRPYFGTRLEQALRASSTCMVSKFGVRFHSRFWERSDLMLPPSFGGQSTTDLPIRWVVYPSYGTGSGDKGVLVMYSWADDSALWEMMSKEEKLRTALDNLQQLYPEVNIAKEYAGGEPGEDGFLEEAIEVNWRFPLFRAGQFLSYYPDLVRPQGNIYFAGGHLGSMVGWTMSAIESARRTVRQLACQYGIEGVDYIYIN